LAIVAAGCGDDASATDGETGTGTSAEASTSTGSSSTTVDTTDGPTTGDTGSIDTGFEPPVEECGNGFVEPGEQCDDGNDVEDDGCNTSCLVPCGLDWEALALAPTGESDVTGMEVGVDGAGNVFAAGYLREVTTDQEGTPTLGPDEIPVYAYDAAGAPLWDLRITGDFDDADLGGLAVDDGGDLYLAMTFETVDGGSDVVVRKLSGADGSELWTHTYDSNNDDSGDEARGIAVAPDGDVVVSATIRAADMDNDVLVRKLAAADGAELWTTTWSGQPDGGFSTDDAGPIAVAPDGAVYVLVREYVDFQTAPAVLMRLPAGGGDPEWTFSPQQRGQVQVYTPIDVEVDADGNVLLAIERLTFGTIEFWVHKLDDTGVQQWVRDGSAYETVGDTWRLGAIALPPTDEIVLVGRYRRTDNFNELAWEETWLRRLNPAGEIQCALDYQAPIEGLIPTAAVAEGAASRADGGTLITGLQEGENEVALWVAAFRPN
jgi:cysteine-rich repeat protein